MFDLRVASTSTLNINVDIPRHLRGNGLPLELNVLSSYWLRFLFILLNSFETDCKVNLKAGNHLFPAEIFKEGLTIGKLVDHEIILSDKGLE